MLRTRQIVTYSKDSCRIVPDIGTFLSRGETMGSLVTTYLRRRDLRNFLQTQRSTIARQLRALDSQVRRLLGSEGVPANELARSDYLHHYVVGILDAITSVYERETRRRLGLELYRDAFVGYLSERFLIARHDAESWFAAISDESRHAGMRDGYADGLLALRGSGSPRRLLDCFEQDVTPMKYVGALGRIPVAMAASA
jgi:hypothetical protein